MIKRKINPDHLIWKTEYNIGSFRVDREHQGLFKLAKKALSVRTLENNEEETKELRAIIQSLYEYTSKHFKSEEKYMVEVGYPELKRHQEIHKDMLIKLYNFTQKIHDLEIDEIELQLYKFIEDYFIHHIVDEDMEIGLWVNSLHTIRTHKGWKKEYESGSKKIDNEHKEMFEILEEAFKEVEDEKREAKIKVTLHHLYEFMKQHFKSEETHMKKINYPEYESHKDIHNKIVKEANELLLNINNTNEKLFEKKLALFIDEHIITHMITEDKKIVEYELLAKERDHKEELFQAMMQ